MRIGRGVLVGVSVGVLALVGVGSYSLSGVLVPSEIVVAGGKVSQLGEKKYISYPLTVKSLKLTEDFPLDDLRKENYIAHISAFKEVRGLGVLASSSPESFDFYINDQYEVVAYYLEDGSYFILSPLGRVKGLVSEGLASNKDGDFTGLMVVKDTGTDLEAYYSRSKVYGVSLDEIPLDYEPYKLPSGITAYGLDVVPFELNHPKESYKPKGFLSYSRESSSFSQVGMLYKSTESGKDDYILVNSDGIVIGYNGTPFRRYALGIRADLVELSYGGVSLWVV